MARCGTAWSCVRVALRQRGRSSEREQWRLGPRGAPTGSDTLLQGGQHDDDATATGSSTALARRRHASSRMGMAVLDDEGGEGIGFGINERCGASGMRQQWRPLNPPVTSLGRLPAMTA
ncbi:hypothetical protein E2562_032202 [Oryza meyeriana var. granulata]|uniref:Uncharacterized protein n=1 Tax=Oryza meyeriana var. granulata TaxID=110450 RepID=A0A6G1F0F4_9ORYZ|nr:hypothetical protein E2562_032202 [Oryza meyeriana var. granulata]